MRIELLKTTPDRVGRYFVQFDNGSVLRLYRQTLEDFSLYSGMELTQEQFEQLSKSAEALSAKMRAVRIVSASNISKKDLESRLVQKGEKPADAHQAVRWLEELNLLDDEKTAEQIVHSCISKGYGLARAKQALYEKRIPKELWEAALADYPDQKDAISAFLKSRITNASDQRQIKRAVDSLLRRGHSYRVIREALNELCFDADDFPEDE
ncbi:MAG: regulatory protein RecX [Faecousia sp.]